MTATLKPDPRLTKVLKALAKDPATDQVPADHAEALAMSSRGFGYDALKVKGKVFAMVSSRAEFVLKLPKARVAELVKAKRGRYFDAGKGKPMQEWFVATDPKLSLAALAKEAFAFVGAKA